MERPSWTDTYLDIAGIMALRSRCSRAQVGAVITDSSNRIIATGYNGPPAYLALNELNAVNLGCGSFCDRGLNGPSHDTLKSYEDCPTIHAEMNALMFVDRRLCEDGLLYVTGHICWTCAKAVANSGLAVVHVRDGGDHAYRSPDNSYELLRDSGLEVFIH